MIATITQFLEGFALGGGAAIGLAGFLVLISFASWDGH